MASPRRSVAVCLLLAAVLTVASSRPARAWGWTAHAMISRAAVDVLPPALRGFYAAHSDFLARHSVDPDKWREESDSREKLCSAERGLPALEGEEAPRHFLDADAIAAYPFRDIPRDFATYRAMAGENLGNWGTAPWAIDAYTELLAQAMRAQRLEVRTILCRSAILSHYVEDFSQPFHLTSNYNGQLSGLDGIHFRFESDLVDYNQAALAARVRAAAPRPLILDEPLESAFEMLVDGFAVVDDLLRADLLAQRAHPLAESQHGADNPAYMSAFWQLAGKITEERMAYGAAKVASYWTTAWDMAGRPDLSALAGADPGR
ncbi:MAG: hypothetical protein ACE5HV_16915 [Acidobacteriota bacterium]